MKIIFLLLICFTFALSCAAQEKCTLELKNAPKLLGLRLGMSADEVQNVFGRSLKIKINKDGKRAFFQNFIKKPAPQALKDVRALYLRFYDRKLYQIEIFYELKNNPQTLETATANFSAQLNLPPAWWENKLIKSQISCPEFSVVADNILNPRIELTDETVRQKLVAEDKQKNQGK